MENFQTLKTKLTELFKKESLEHRLISNAHSLELNQEKTSEINLSVSPFNQGYELFLDGYFMKSISEDDLYNIIQKLLEKKMRIIETKAAYFPYEWELQELENGQWLRIGKRTLRLYPFWKKKDRKIKYLL